VRVVFVREFWPFRDRVFRLAYKILGDPDEAEDLAQEVFLACLSNLSGKGADFCASPEGYLFRSTYHRAADRFRRKSRRPTTSLEESIPDKENTPPEECIEGGAGESPRDEALLLEIREHLDLALSQLSRRERRAFVLRVFEDESYRAIADDLGVTEDQVRSYIHRSRMKILDHFEGRFDCRKRAKRQDEQ
jgi:RNA polymerase sigma-70 factor (ECF subfamily)